MYLLKVLLLQLLLLNSSCTTLKDSLLLGAIVGSSVGGGFGAAIGNQNNKPRQGALVGAGVGLVLGSLLGYFGHGDAELRAARLAKLNSRSGEDTDDPPKLTVPRVKKIWIPESIENDKYISGHWIYVLDHPSSWRRPDDERK